MEITVADLNSVMAENRQLIFISVIGVLQLFAFVGNLATILVVARDPKLLSLTTVLMCNLAISDIILGSVGVPQQLHDMTHAHNFYEREYILI